MKALNVRLLRAAGPGRWAWGLLGLVAVAALLLVGRAHLARQELQALRSDVTGLVESVELAAQQRVLDQARARQLPDWAEDFMRERVWPWPQALAVIEATSPDGVAVQRVDISVKAQSVTLSVTAPDAGSALDWVGRLTSQGKSSGQSCWDWAATDLTAQPEGAVQLRVLATCGVR